MFYSRLCEQVIYAAGTPGVEGTCAGRRVGFLGCYFACFVALLRTTGAGEEAGGAMVQESSQRVAASAEPVAPRDVATGQTFNSCLLRLDS